MTTHDVKVSTDSRKLCSATIASTNPSFGVSLYRFTYRPIMTGNGRLCSWWLGLVVFVASFCCSSQPVSGNEQVARWNFSRDNDLNFDNYPDGWKRTYDRWHPRYLKMEIVPHDSQFEIAIKKLDQQILEAWLAVRNWGQRLPFTRLTVQATPSLLPVVQYGFRAMPPLPPSLSDSLVNRYLRAEVNGGAIMATSPIMPVDLDYSYRLQARIRTQDLVHNLAWLEMVFADEKGRPVEVLSSRKFGATNAWTQIEIGPKSPPRRSEVMWLNVRYEPQARADLSGWAGFDDLLVTRFPRIRIETDQPLAIYEAGSKPKIRCVVSGIQGQGRSIDFRLLDDRGNPVLSANRALVRVSSTSDDVDFPRPLILSANDIGGVATWDLPQISPGFYRIQGSLSGTGDSEFVVEHTLAVTSNLPAGPGPFGWSITGKATQVIPLQDLPIWLEQNRVQWFKYSCWIDHRDVAAADDLAWLAGRLQDRRIEMVGVLDRPPESVLVDLSADVEDPAAILFRDPSLWQPVLEPIMTRLTSGIRWWQLGFDRDYSFLGRSQLKQVIEEIHVGLQGFGQAIQVAINWPWLEKTPPVDDWSWHTVLLSERTPFTADEIDAYFEEPEKNEESAADAVADNSDGGQPANASPGDSNPNAPATTEANATPPETGVDELSSAATNTSSGSLFSTASFRPEEFAEELAQSEELGGAQSPNPWIILQPLDRNQYSRSDRIGDLIRRMIAVRRQKISAAFVSEPFNPDLGMFKPDGTPDEMLLPWRTGAALLANVFPVGSLELPNESENVLLANADTAMMVVWSDRPKTETIYLGTKAKHIDAFGRELPIRQVKSRGFDVQAFDVTDEPSFLIDVDRTAALWRLGVRLDRGRIDSLLGRPQSVNLIFQNPSVQPLNGNVRIETPESWNVSNVPRPIAVDSFRRREEPIRILLRGDATIGRELLAIDFELEGEEKRSFTVWRPLEVGPEDILMDVSTRLLPDGRLIVRQEITNTAGGTKQFDCYVYAPGRRRQRRSVTVESGQTTIQEFVWFSGAELIGEELLLRAEQQGGERTLNFRFKATR